MTKSIAVKEETILAEVPKGSWGAENTLKSDIIVPRILLMQAMSKLCQEDKAKSGEIRASLDGKLLGTKDKPIQIIPFLITASWVHFKMVNGKYEFQNISERTPTNDSLPFEEEIKGEKLKHVRAINAYVLIPSEVEKEEIFPYLISFQNTSFPAGRKLVSAIEKLKIFNQPPASKVFSIGLNKRTNEKGSWWVFDTVESCGPSKREHLDLAYQWYLTVTKGGVKIDESAMDDDTNTVDTTTTKF